MRLSGRSFGDKNAIIKESENQQPQIIIYETDDSVIKVSVRLEDETAWLTNLQLAELFEVSKSTVSEHIKNIFTCEELSPDAVVRKFRTTAADGKNSHEQAVGKAKSEYVKYQARTLSDAGKQYLNSLKIAESSVKGRA